MRDVEKILTALADRVFTARLASGLPVRDVTDVSIYLREQAARAAKAKSVEEFLAGLD